MKVSILNYFYYQDNQKLFEIPVELFGIKSSPFIETSKVTDSLQY